VRATELARTSGRDGRRWCSRCEVVVLWWLCGRILVRAALMAGDGAGEGGAVAGGEAKLQGCLLKECTQERHA
jgi:hypothetical protein